VTAQMATAHVNQNVFRMFLLREDGSLSRVQR